MKSIGYLFVAATLAASCSPKVFPVENKTVDSVRVEKAIEYRDTVINVPVPSESVENRTYDSTSYLRTSFAESSAKIEDGVLHHTLRNLDTTMLVPVPMILTNVTTDRQKVMSRTNVIEVEKKLNGWQRTIMTLGYMMLILIAGLIGYGICRVFKLR